MFTSEKSFLRSKLDLNKCEGKIRKTARINPKFLQQRSFRAQMGNRPTEPSISRVDKQW